jgi:bifunctional non-homologous end joining protein LigD
MGRGEPSYCAFDLVWLNGRDLRQKALLERKRLLRELVPKNHSRLLYMSHVDSGGSRFFHLVCQQDLEGIICKPRTSTYPFTWVKVKNPAYTQAVDRGEWFNGPRKYSVGKGWSRRRSNCLIDTDAADECKNETGRTVS